MKFGLHMFFELLNQLLASESLNLPNQISISFGVMIVFGIFGELRKS